MLALPGKRARVRLVTGYRMCDVVSGIGDGQLWRWRHVVAGVGWWWFVVVDFTKTFWCLTELGIASRQLGQGVASTSNVHCRMCSAGDKDISTAQAVNLDALVWSGWRR